METTAETPTATADALKKGGAVRFKE